MLDEMNQLACKYFKTNICKKGEFVEVQYKKNKIFLYVLGIGKKNVQKSLKKIEKDIHKFDLIFFIGIAGAISKDLRVGDIIVPCNLITQTGKTIQLNGLLKECLNYNGALLSSDNFVSKAEKQKFANIFIELSAVDMEDFFIAEYIMKLSRKIIVIKTISDSYNSILPDENFLIKNYRYKDIKTQFKNLIHDPYNSLKMSFFKINIKKAIKKNSKFVFKIIEEYSSV